MVHPEPVVIPEATEIPDLLDPAVSPDLPETRVHLVMPDLLVPLVPQEDREMPDVLDPLEVPVGPGILVFPDQGEKMESPDHRDLQ